MVSFLFVHAYVSFCVCFFFVFHNSSCVFSSYGVLLIRARTFRHFLVDLNTGMMCLAFVDGLDDVYPFVKSGAGVVMENK